MPLSSATTLGTFTKFVHVPSFNVNAQVKMDEKFAYTLLSFILWFGCTNTQFYTPTQTEFRRFCPHLYHRTFRCAFSAVNRSQKKKPVHFAFRGYVPRGNLSAGIYTEVDGATDMKNCASKCCLENKCNVAFMMDTKCYHVACVSNELCLPTLSDNVEPADRVAMVLVKPTDEDTWEDVLGQQGNYDGSKQNKTIAMTIW